MKLIEKIEKLLQSTQLNDGLIAIAISYQLPWEEFDAFFDRKVPTRISTSWDKHYYFLRNGKVYFWGSAYLGRSENELRDFAEFASKYDISTYVDLTPDNK